MPKSSEADRERARLWYQNNKERAKANRKKYYWSNPEKFRADTKAYWDERREAKRLKDQIYKDKRRHAGKRLELILKNGLRCSQCGIEEDPYQIVAHHLRGKDQHEFQVLLSRSCHAKLHDPLGIAKPDDLCYNEQPRAALENEASASSFG
jgi:hypothetical protein